jgi:hypothetical protein
MRTGNRVASQYVIAFLLGHTACFWFHFNKGLLDPALNVFVNGGMFNTTTTLRTQHTLCSKDRSTSPPFVPLNKRTFLLVPCLNSFSQTWVKPSSVQRLVALQTKRPLYVQQHLAGWNNVATQSISRTVNPAYIAISNIVTIPEAKISMKRLEFDPCHCFSTCLSIVISLRPCFGSLQRPRSH